ncbi:MAG: hypothetical protein F6K18_08715 [Okeania sp. SIO2C2]|uniref:hypothetical protein n=1 Tax=Okeania sp. SIO2C2 TaxID=2607787 RepID=UPI0013B60FD5|nr:hypothetical protein [Okeania sp. SIO2C2]NEP86908.1 hypothetical protein [Okeania sp. SIO2C2]
MSWSIGIEEGRRKKEEGRKKKEERRDTKKLPRPLIAPQPILGTVGKVGVLHP